MPKTPLQLHFQNAPPKLQQACVFLMNDLGSTHPDHRTDLRSSVQDQLQSLNITEPLCMNNLKSPLTHPRMSISLSHTLDASAFVWTPLPSKAGIDIEQLNRIQKNTVQRVSTAFECSTAPDIRFLWSAKEATFKALSPLCRTVSEIEILSWSSLNTTNWIYSARLIGTDQKIDGIGLVCIISEHVLSFFISSH